MKKICCAGKRLVLLLAVMILILSGIAGAQAKTTLHVIGEFYDWPICNGIRTGSSFIPGTN